MNWLGVEIAELWAWSAASALDFLVALGDLTVFWALLSILVKEDNVYFKGR